MESNRASKLGVVISTSLLVFTFCIFGPFQIYITNVSELFFSFGDIWWICALTALVSGAVIIGIGLLLKGKLREFYCCALWGLALALYIQGNFILTDYGTLDGSIDWGNYRGVGIWNSILWIALITLPFLLYQFVPQLWKFARNYAALVILGMQVVTLCTLFLTVDGDSNSNFQLTNRGKLELSKNENILETKNPVFSMLSSVKCRNSQEINDFSTLSDTLFYPLSQNQKYLQSGFHPNPEGYRKSTVRLDNC